MKRKFLLLGVVLCMSATLSLQAQGLPAVRLKDISGKTVDTSKLNNDGKPLLVSFFALWCKPCMKELKAISEVYEEWQEKTGVRLVAVSVDDARSTDKVPVSVRAQGFEWTTLLDPNSELKRAMGVNQIPHLFLLDGKGNIAWQHTSYSEGSEELILEELLKLTKE